MILSSRCLVMASVRNKAVTGGGSSRHLNRFLKFAWISLGDGVQGFGQSFAFPAGLCLCPGRCHRSWEGEKSPCMIWKLSHLFVLGLCAVFNLKSELQQRLRAGAPPSAPSLPAAVLSIPPPSRLVQHLLLHSELECEDIAVVAAPVSSWPEPHRQVPEGASPSGSLVGPGRGAWGCQWPPPALPSGAFCCLCPGL